MSHAILLNFSGHKCPDSCLNHLEEKGYKSFSLFSTKSVSFDLVEADVWQQVEDVFSDLATKKDRWGKNAYEAEGDIFILIPALSSIAVLISSACEKLWGTAPQLMIVTRIDKRAELSQVIDLRAWSAKWRSSGRSEYLCVDKSGTFKNEQKSSPLLILNPKGKTVCQIPKLLG